MKIFEQHPHWNSVLQVCKTLTGQNHKAWLAGGCVRDAIRNMSPQDFDIATSASPEEVQKIFPKSIDVGKAFGVMILPFDGFQIEVASFRTDGVYRDGRRPEAITLSTPEQDAKRRDFTVNALFYDPVKKEVHDFVGGERDLKAGLLRAVGDPSLRFEEDHLRILRGVRFAAQLGFQLEDKTFHSMKALAPKVSKVSVERIRDEMAKLLKSPRPTVGFQIIEDLKLLGVIAPELASLEPTFFWERTKKIFELLGDPKTDDLEVLFALFLMHSFDPHQRTFVPGEAFLQRCKFSNQQKALISGIVKAFWDLSLNPQPLSRKRRYLALYKSALVLFLEKASVLYPVEKLVSELKTLPQDLPKPLLTGEDLKNMGVPPGALMGQILLQAMDLQLEGLLNNHDRALRWLKRMFPKG